MDAIGATVAITSDEFVEGQKVLMKLHKRDQTKLVGGGFVVIGLLLAPTLSWGVLPLILVGVLFMTGWLVTRSLRSTYRRIPDLAEPVNLQFGPIGFSSAVVGSESRSSWARVKQIGRTPTMVVLAMGRGTAHFLPTRCFAPGQIEQILQWCALAGGPITPAAV
jgi:hypothetical protein